MELLVENLVQCCAVPAAGNKLKPLIQPFEYSLVENLLASAKVLLDFRIVVFAAVYPPILKCRRQNEEVRFRSL